LWWTKRRCGRFSPSTSISPANHHSTNFSIIIITRSWHSRPIGGRNAELAQLDSTPHYTNKKKGKSHDILKLAIHIFALAFVSINNCIYMF
jgi:hypothetical protein